MHRMHLAENAIGSRAPPRSTGGAFSAPPDLLAVFKGREGVKERREGEGGKEGERG